MWGLLGCQLHVQKIKLCHRYPIGQAELNDNWSFELVVVGSIAGKVNA